MGIMSKQELAYQTIRQRIVDGTCGPGYRIVIDELARELGCSAIPVREAVRRLEAEGLLEYTRHTGARVISIDEQQYVDTLATLAVLEGYATAEAAAHLEPACLGTLERLTREMRQAVEAGDMLRYGELNRTFHETIYRSCPNDYLIDQIRLAWARLDSMRHSIFVLIPERARASLTDHDRIIALLADGAPAGMIEAEVRQHKLATARQFHTWRVGRRPSPNGAQRAVAEHRSLIGSPAGNHDEAQP